MLQVGRTAITLVEILASWESFPQFLRSFTERVLPTGTELVDANGGCVCFTVQANSLKGLTTLWNMYKDGTLKARLYDFLVTEKVKHLAEAEENVELTVTIEEEEYKRACIKISSTGSFSCKIFNYTANQFSLRLQISVSTLN